MVKHRSPKPQLGVRVSLPLLRKQIKFYLFLQNRTLKSNLYTLTYILFLSKTFGQALDRLVNVR